MLAEGLIHLHFMSPYTLFRNNSQTQQDLTVLAKIYISRFQCGEHNMLLLLGEGKENKRRCHFILREQLPQYTGCGLPFPSLFSMQLEILRVRGRQEGAYIPHHVLTFFLPHPHSTFPWAEYQGCWLSPG